VFATIEPSLRHLGIRGFVVEKGTPGLRQGKVEDKMGVRASHTAEVILEDCEIPAENMLGREDEPAFVGAMKTLESSRPLVAAGAVGIARAAYEYALEYSRNRKTFGKPIATRQAIAFMLADMKTKIEAARLLTWRAAWMHDQGMPMNKEASYAKLFAADAAMERRNCRSRTPFPLTGPPPGSRGPARSAGGRAGRRASSGRPGG